MTGPTDPSARSFELQSHGRESAFEAAKGNVWSTGQARDFAESVWAFIARRLSQQHCPAGFDSP
jgi:hypothetical protein